jgi:hypothetical protein
MAINNLQLLIVDDDVDLGRHLKSFFGAFSLQSGSGHQWFAGGGIC